MHDQPIAVAPPLASTAEPMPPAFGGVVKHYAWIWEGRSIQVVYEVLGQGPPVLLLPALSSVCSRVEMAGLARELAQKYQVYALDWVGFGQSDRPAIDYAPKLYRALLRDFASAVLGQPVVVIAAGHTAGYVMQLAQEQSNPWRWVVLVSPTWRGPLPTMMGESKRSWFKWGQKLVNTPIVGQLLYWANTTQGFLGWMYGRHVFADRRAITPALLAVKQGLSRQPNGRLAAAAFVTGALDPLRSRDDWMKLFQSNRVPVLMVIGEQMPPKSRQEAEVVAHFGGGVQVVRMPGALGLHEEYPVDLADRVVPFLDKYLS
jgi:pimeloyl-ACP methyl ester carboxylesterase